MIHTRALRPLTFVVAAVTVAACTGRESPRAGDTTADTPAVDPPAMPPASSWIGELGPLMLVPSDSENAAIVLFPEAPPDSVVRAARFSLVNASGNSAAARGALTDEQCGDAPIVRLGATPPLVWSVGFAGAATTPLAMDSIEALAPSDSARLAADLARIASGLSDGSESRFRGLPFAVRAAHRLALGTGQPEVVAAHLVRRLNIEANPLEEHTLVVVERSTRASAAATDWKVAYRLHSEGAEDTAEHYTVLAAVRAGTRTLLVVARDQVSRTTYEILERSASGDWRSRWLRRLTC